MDAHKKLEFVQKMTKLGLQHFDSGGGVISAGNGGPLGGIAGALTVQNGYNASAPTSGATIGQQQAQLAGQLQNEAAGNGPNPAQIQYQQNANQIARQQASDYANNRALNPGLAARMAGNTAAQVGQTAAGTAAAQQAQQQLAAQGQMANLTGQEQQGYEQAQGINAQVAQNNTNSVQNTSGGLLQSIPVIGSIFAKGGEVKKYANGGTIQVRGVANMSNAGDITPESFGGPGNMSSLFSSGPSNFGAPQLTQPELGSSAGFGKSPVSLGGSQMASQLSAAPDLTADAGGAATGMGGADALSAELSQVAPLAATAALAKGGQVPKSLAGKYLTTARPKMKNMASGGDIDSGFMAAATQNGSNYANSLSGTSTPSSVPGKGSSSGAGTPITGMMGGAASALPGLMSGMSNGGLMKSGGKVKAPVKSERAAVKGDSYKNDKVPAMLSQGEIVIPRHITMQPNAPQKAAAFVQAVLNKKRMGKK